MHEKNKSINKIDKLLTSKGLYNKVLKETVKTRMQKAIVKTMQKDFEVYKKMEN